MPKNCGHELIDVLDTSESGDGNDGLATRVEGCRICGYRRTVIENNGKVSEGPWEPFRISVTPDPSI